MEETGFYYVANLGAEVMNRFPFSADSPYSFLRNFPISYFDFLGLCDPDAKEQLTIRMTSFDKDLANSFKDLPHAKDYKDMISKLKCKSDNCIKSFVLVAHGNQSTIQFNEKDRDLDMNWSKAEKMWGDVKANACFCRKCFIYLLSCYTGDQNGPTTYAQKVANATGCTVVAPKGYCWPNPDNPFSSKVDNDYDGKTPFTKKNDKWNIVTPIGGKQ